MDRPDEVFLGWHCDALRGDKTVQEIAPKHKVQPNQVSTWKRQAINELGEVFSTGGAASAKITKPRFAVFMTRSAI